MYDSPQVEREHIDRLHQRETVLSCSKARYYNPSVGRFASEDPVGIPSISLYSYTLGNPLTFTDPLGLYEITGQVGVHDIRSIQLFRLECKAAAGECADRTDKPRVLSVKCRCFCTPSGFATVYTLTIGGRFIVYGGPWSDLNKKPCDPSVVDAETAQNHARTVHVDPAVDQLGSFLWGLELRRYASYNDCKTDCDAQGGVIRARFQFHLQETIDQERKECGIK